MKAMLVIVYVMAGHVIDSESVDAANMDECHLTKRLVLAEKTPITTRYSSNVKVSAECKQITVSADRGL